MISQRTSSSRSPAGIAAVALGPLRGHAGRDRGEDGPRRRVAELDDAVAVARLAGCGHDPVDAGRDDAVGELLEHHPRVDDDLALGGDGIDPAVVRLHLQAGRAGPGEGGDQVDVAVGARPDVALVRSQVHGRVVDGAGQVRPVVEHAVEERLVAADGHGDDVQEAPLQVGDAVVELVEHLGDAGHRGLRQHLRPVPVRVAGAERMPLGRLPAPVEHLLPVRHVATTRPSPPAVPCTPSGRGSRGRRSAALSSMRLREELGQHAVGLVEEGLRQVVAGVDEAGLQAPSHPVDDGPPRALVALLEGQQVDVEDGVGHGRRLILWRFRQLEPDQQRTMVGQAAHRRAEVVGHRGLGDAQVAMDHEVVDPAARARWPGR